MTTESIGNRGVIRTRDQPMNHPGFYSVVGFCPDIERGETVNVGVVIGAPGLGMRVRMAERNEYVKRRFGAEAFDNTRLTLAKNDLAHRLEEVHPTAEALAAFGAAEAGKLQITTPRPMPRPSIFFGVPLPRS